MAWLNYYECPECIYRWGDYWECQVDDTCPCCGHRNISPTESKEIELAHEQGRTQ
jgi:hypothetical protein